jgi:hypothetical protein
MEGRIAVDFIVQCAKEDDLITFPHGESGAHRRNQATCAGRQLLRAC